jgi:5'-phosphate synthase pdxT subunit
MPEQHKLDWILSPTMRPAPAGPGAGLIVGVLALQGDFREHRVMLERLGAGTREVRRPADLEGCDALVIPGGESTTMHRLMTSHGLTDRLRAFARSGHAVYGTCAGLILAARETVEASPPTLGLIDIVARRNAFGRQVDSFEADLELPAVGARPVRAIFIRAPWIERAGAGVEVLAIREGHAVAAREGGVLVTAFHPELTGDSRLHELFLEMARRRGGRGARAGWGQRPSSVHSDCVAATSLRDR